MASPNIPDDGGDGETQPLQTYLNLNVRGMGQSATIAINERSAELVARGRTIYRLGLGQSPFPVPAPVVEALRAHAHEKDYLPVKGLASLREAVAAYLQRRWGLVRNPARVLIGPGSKELMFLLQLVYYGDLVIPTPAWVSYAPQAHIIGRQVRWLRTRRQHDWLLRPEQLETLCELDADRPRIVVLNYPSNPTGCSYDEQALERLAAVARRYHVVLLSDEIYGELRFDGAHQTIARYYPEGTILSTGLSKWCGAGGWRLGSFVFPEGLGWLCDTMAAVASETYTSTAAPIQHAAVTAFAGGPTIDSYLDDSRRVLAALAHYCTGVLRGAALDVTEAVGAFYLFPSFKPHAERLRKRGIRTSRQLCRKLLDDTGVAVLPGSAFGRRSSELLARMALVDFDGAVALEAARRQPGVLGESFVRQHCPRMVAALDALARWLGGA